ncbi:MAG: 7-cyano-7-deazaguanine synthase QueC [Desulfomonile tiedjei]|uniref:7-cyano-7-deazaguanine synthase n=1 Tax=Desulfomonile tiedjei TaxID=2358 RepID=A0A9D6Z135_9BACT|nr:7-cyano-7-deazaguanine synthase QueC [Desulfomonile tiedjei]
MENCDKKAVVLLSGGIDSSTCLAIAKQQGHETYALSFQYHQRHQIEIAAARRVAEAFKVEAHMILELPLGNIGGSALTADIEVPKSADVSLMPKGIPVTYVPARNTIFLSFALAWAEVLSAENVFIGVNALDYSGYPDCRPEYIHAFETMANLATKKTIEGTIRFRIHTPLIRLSKAEIIKKGIQLGVDYGITHSCYDPDPHGRACGHCDSCLLRRKGFIEAGEPDPTIYVK